MTPINPTEYYSFGDIFQVEYSFSPAFLMLTRISPTECLLICLNISAPHFVGTPWSYNRIPENNGFVLGEDIQKCMTGSAGTPMFVMHAPDFGFSQDSSGQWVGKIKIGQW